MDFRQTIRVKSTPAQVFKAVTLDYRYWWTKASGQVYYLRDDVTFRFDDTYWTFVVVKLEQNQVVEMLCTDAHHVHEGLDSSIDREWLGTKLRWDIDACSDDEHCEVTLTHIGLNDELDCYHVCQAGWNYYLTESLKSYLSSGAGNPYNSCSTHKSFSHDIQTSRDTFRPGLAPS
ncbi:SRPBCC domain-containing protein [Vibrio sp. SCSIO 43136]|uniref:SRPBCC domain-containing protein n=1 Tax=Vibrio sp. SCSIO 43136 TaxID=2819101 RepID=UPI0020760F5F|nr:SRPBCC domain-containing protein [Vibrio sp. SCSIO 43136]USD66762.1 hypothetical protein J4N39_19085 [Vibrio sp. SCSIO 43136]